MYVFMNQQVCREGFISLHRLNRAKTAWSKATPMGMQGRHRNCPHKITEDLKKPSKSPLLYSMSPSIYRFDLVPFDSKSFIAQQQDKGTIMVHLLVLGV